MNREGLWRTCHPVSPLGSVENLSKVFEATVKWSSYPDRNIHVLMHTWKNVYKNPFLLVSRLQYREGLSPL